MKHALTGDIYGGGTQVIPLGSFRLDKATRAQFKGKTDEFSSFQDFPRHHLREITMIDFKTNCY